MRERKWRGMTDGSLLVLVVCTGYHVKMSRGTETLILFTISATIFRLGEILTWYPSMTD